METRAGLISVNFAGTDQSLGTADAAGVVSATNWNNAYGTTGANLTLLDSTGALSGALLSYAATDARNQSAYLVNPGNAGFSPWVRPSTADANTNHLWDGALVGFNDTPNEVSISVTNIPYAKYDVYVYANTNSPYTGSMGVTDGTTTFRYTSPGTAVSPASLTQNFGSVNAYGVYQIFTDKTSSTLNLSTVNGFAYSPSEVYGLQIVEVQPVPEPATFAVGLLCLGASMIRRRRRLL
jgi:hypothetical protein